MNDTTVTVIGNVASDPATATTRSGIPVAHFRLASTSRRFDREANDWKDAGTLWFTVNCWRGLGQHVVDSLHRGDGVVVFGRLSQRTWEDSNGTARTSLEVDATSVGPDLARGTAVFRRAVRVPGPADDEWTSPTSVAPDGPTSRVTADPSAAPEPASAGAASGVAAA